MAKLLGVPMIGHVYRRVSINAALHLTAVATCDQEIADYVRSIGGRAVMTGDHHERASDRCAEALEIIERMEGAKYDIVVMVQGDEPMVHPEMLTEALGPLLDDPTVQISNLLGRIRDISEFEDRNCIKVVCDQNGNALYFSREPIPTRAKEPSGPMSKQICVIPFRRDFLLEYTRMSPTPLEIAESVDMMRVIENGRAVRMVPTVYETQSVDTPEDLKRVEEFMQVDPLYRQMADAS